MSTAAPTSRSSPVVVSSEVRSVRNESSKAAIICCFSVVIVIAIANLIAGIVILCVKPKRQADDATWPYYHVRHPHLAPALLGFGLIFIILAITVFCLATRRYSIFDVDNQPVVVDYVSYSPYTGPPGQQPFPPTQVSPDGRVMLFTPVRHNREDCAHCAPVFHPGPYPPPTGRGKTVTYREGPPSVIGETPSTSRSNLPESGKIEPVHPRPGTAGN